MHMRLDNRIEPEIPALPCGVCGQAIRSWLQAMIDDDRTETHIRRTT